MQNEVSVQEKRKASGKSIMKREEALSLIEEAEFLQIAKGRKRTTINLNKDQPSEDELMEHMLGRTGNMRAPTVIFGKTVIVGFNAEMYTEILLP